jgi:hypothetical protein
VVEALASLGSPTPALAALLLQQAQRWPQDAAWQAWALPLVARAAVGSHPPAAAATWLGLVRLAAAASPAAAQQLCSQALQAHPFHSDLWQLHCSFQPSEGAVAVALIQ